jgi:restriction system protein
MARGSSWSGSYREREAAQRARQRAGEQAARQKERERAHREAADRDEDATARTLAVEQRVAELEGLLRSSLARDPRISLDSLWRRVAVPPLDLGEHGGLFSGARFDNKSIK